MDWIIAIASSAINGVVINRFFGTEEEVKALLVELATEDETFEYGTEDVFDIEDTGIELNAYAVCSSYRINYTAKRFCDVEFL